MKRRTGFLTGIVAAAITFGTLTATMGPRHFNRHGGRCHNMETCDDKNKTSNSDGRMWDDKGDNKSTPPQQANQQHNN